MPNAEFKAIIKPQPGMNAAFIEFPFDPMEYFGSNGRIKIKATFDNSVIYRGLLTKMDKDGCHLIGLNQEIRKQLGKQAGDEVYVILEKDDEERTVEIPRELQEILNQTNDLNDYFQKLSFTHRKEYVRWITDAKKEETKLSRIAKIPELLRNKIKTPHAK